MKGFKMDLLDEFLQRGDKQPSSNNPIVSTVISQTKELHLNRDEMFTQTNMVLSSLPPQCESVIGIALDPSNAAAYLNVYPLVIQLFKRRIPFCMLDAVSQPLSWMKDAVDGAGIEYIICSEGALNKIECEFEPVLKGELCLIKLMNVPTDQEYVDNTAYVAQTSGTSSSGHRKTVFVPRSAIAADVADFTREFQICPGREFLSLSQTTFDPFILDLLLCYACQSHLLLPDQRVKMSPRLLWERVLTRYRVEFVQIVPTLYRNLVRLKDKGWIAENVVLGGEEFPTKELQMAGGGRFYMAYGLTEMSCWQSLLQVKNLPIPIWDPEENLIASTKFHLFDPRTEKLTEEELVEGEIVITGPNKICHISGVGRRTNLKTKDIGVWKNGKLYFKGRMEDHIKISGKRCSYAEVERILSEVIGENVVAFDRERQLLHAFIRGSDSDVIEAERECAAARLPGYLIPKSFHPVSEFPINNNGKIDRHALLKIAQSRKHPEKRKVKALRDLWKDYTGLEPKAGSNFLEDGGDSFKAVLLGQELSEEDDGLLDIILNKTFADVGQHLAALKGGCSKVMRRTDDGKFIPSAQESPLALRWSIDLGKCVDASPLLWRRSVYIGSHSGAFVKIDLDSGKEVWRAQLPDRVESTAAASEESLLTSEVNLLTSEETNAISEQNLLTSEENLLTSEEIISTSECPSLIYFGCHDSSLHALNSETGSEEWTYKTGSLVKSTPLVIGGKVLFGSYDHHLYCLDSQTGSLHWKTTPSDSSISAKAAAHAQSVFCAALDGNIACMALSTGEIIWKNSDIKSPVFSSPKVLNDFLVIAHANGKVVFRCLNDGSVKWALKEPLSAPVFSQIVTYNDYVLFGCHDKHLYCLDKQASIVFRVKHPAEVFAGPAVTTFSGHPVIISLSVDGTMLMTRFKDGKVIKMFKTSSGEERDSFSSPVVCDNAVIFGSRKDRVCAYDFPQ